MPACLPSEELIRLGFDPRVVPPDGEGSSGILVCAEAPGKHESDSGIPLNPRADAGSVWAKVMRRANVKRGELTLTNCCWQRPPLNELVDQSYESQAVEFWRPWNQALVKVRKPKVAILLGNVALRAYTQYGRAEKQSITHIQNYSFPITIGGEEVIALPSLHPSFILHGQQAFTQTLIWALQRARQLVKEGIKKRDYRLITSLNVDEARKFESGFNPDRHILSFDIETPESSNLDEDEVEDEERDISYNIKRFSLCYDGVVAGSWPWMEPFIGMLKRMTAKAVKTEGWNSRDGGGFDIPRLKAAGVTFPGRHYDRMLSWAFLQPTLPRSLGFASPLLGWQLPPWKYRGQEDEEEYAALDALATRWNGEAIEAALRARGTFDLHERHVVECYEILTQMGRNGLPYDREEAGRFRVRLEGMKKEREDTLQLSIPNSLKPGKQKEGYKKSPKSFEGCEKREFILPFKKLTVLEKAIGKPYLSDLQNNGEKSPILETDLFIVERWVKVTEFKPTSTQQLQKLIKFYGHKVGRNRKTKRNTADDETIRKIIQKCSESEKARDKEFLPILKMCREVKQLQKVISTYLNGWQPGADGRIHSTPGFWGKMFRVSWRKPNISATVADKQEEYIAAGFRKCVRASKGRVLVECVAPESKILRSDLTWVNAADIKVGDDLIGFTDVNGHKSCYTSSIVESVQVINRPRVKVSTTMGDTIVAENHLFVGRFKSYQRRWIAASNLMGHKNTGAFLSFFGKPWERENSWEAGYISGFADGEGSISKSKSSIAQNAGPTIDYVINLLHERGFYPQFYGKIRSKLAFGSNSTKPYKVQQWEFGQMYDTMRLLGVFRPRRLMQKQRQVWEGRRTWGKKTILAQALKVESLGVGPVIAIKTTTGNYISDGFLSHNCDYKGIEAVLVGWFAKDEDYMRLAKIGVHDYFCAHILASKGKILKSDIPSLSLSDAELKPIFKDFKKRFPKDRDDAKHVVHLTAYLGTPLIISVMYEMPIQETERLQGLYFSLFPKVKQWQEATKEKAHKEIFLTCPWGYRMPFWEIYRWNSKRYESLKKIWDKQFSLTPSGMKWVLNKNEKEWLDRIVEKVELNLPPDEAIAKLCYDLGEDAKSAVSFVPRDTAAGILKEALLRLRGYAFDGTLLTSTHDAILGETEEGKMMWLARLLKEEMEKPITVLDNLVIGVEAKAGESWSDEMEVIEFPN